MRKPKKIASACCVIWINAKPGGRLAPRVQSECIAAISPRRIREISHREFFHVHPGRSVCPGRSRRGAIAGPPTPRRALVGEVESGGERARDVRQRCMLALARDQRLWSRISLRSIRATCCLVSFSPARA